MNWCDKHLRFAGNRCRYIMLELARATGYFYKRGTSCAESMAVNICCSMSFGMDNNLTHRGSRHNDNPQIEIDLDNQPREPPSSPSSNLPSNDRVRPALLDEEISHFDDPPFAPASKTKSTTADSPSFQSAMALSVSGSVVRATGVNCGLHVVPREHRRTEHDPSAQRAYPCIPSCPALPPF